MLLQGEVGVPDDGFEIHLLYSCEKMKMRDALLTSGKRVKGLAAAAILQTFLWPRDYDEMMRLTGDFQGHAIEFGTYGYALGNIPNRNTIIWEVRHY